MAEITRINEKRTFGFVEATALLPVIRRITQEAVTHAEALALRYESLPEVATARAELESELSLVILAWAAKVRKLGAEAKGVWLVDFDAGDGTAWTWRHPGDEFDDDLGSVSSG